MLQPAEPPGHNWIYFSPVALSYVNLMVRTAKEPKRTEEMFSPQGHDVRCNLILARSITEYFTSGTTAICGCSSLPC